MKKLIQLIFLTIVPFAVYAQNTADLSGKWLVNIAKSDMHGLPDYAAVKQLDIQQTGTILKIKRTLLDAQNNEKTSLQTDTIDGHEHQIAVDNGIKINKLSWSSDRQTLKTVSNYVFPNQAEKNYLLTQNWKLINEGKNLEVEMISPTYTIKVIYDKQ